MKDHGFYITRVECEKDGVGTLVGKKVPWNKGKSFFNINLSFYTLGPHV